MGAGPWVRDGQRLAGVPAIDPSRGLGVGVTPAWTCAPGGRHGLLGGLDLLASSTMLGLFYGVARVLLGCGLAPLVPSSLGRCGRVELGGLEFDGAALVWQYACPDGGSESPGWWVGADLRPQASSHPSSCQVTGLGVILEARRGRAAGLWLALSRPFPVPHLFPASPGREVYASPHNLSSLCLIFLHAPPCTPSCARCLCSATASPPSCSGFPESG